MNVAETKEIVEIKELERKEGIENVIYNSFNNPYTSDNSVHTFLLGESNRDKELRRERERLEELNRVRKTLYTESYTGQGYDIKVVGTSWEECVIYAKRITGITRSIGYAGYAKPQGQDTKIGSIALEKGHASVVIADYGDSIRVREANYKRGKITERTIPKNQIRGYIYG